MSDTHDHDHVLQLGRRWADAEQSGDVAALDDLAAQDFTLVGPLGFVLDKAQWLDRYRSGALVTVRLTWTDVQVRDYGPVAVAIGIHTQQAAYQGRAADGSFRSTHIAIRNGHDRGHRWLLAGIHLSPLGAPESRAAAGDRGRVDR
jgi:ketosteroid isomerase-like protein